MIDTEHGELPKTQLRNVRVVAPTADRALLETGHVIAEEQPWFAIGNGCGSAAVAVRCDRAYLPGKTYHAEGDAANQVFESHSRSPGLS